MKFRFLFFKYSFFPFKDDVKETLMDKLFVRNSIYREKRIPMYELTHLKKLLRAIINCQRIYIKK